MDEAAVEQKLPLPLPLLTTTIILWPLYRQCTLAGTLSSELEDFVGAKFYCLNALPDDI